MSSEPRLIWYRLIDSGFEGQPFKGTSADCISVPSNHVVAQFRDAVQSKWDKPGYLKDVPAGALIVYKKKDTWDKRNKKDGTKEELVKPSSTLSCLGESEEEALIVVVPLIPRSETDEPNTKTRKVVEQNHFVQVLKQKLPNPSSFAHFKSKGCWVDFLKSNPNTIICHRDSSEQATVPVCLLNPIFNTFVHDMNHINISSEDCKFVVELTDRMCGAFIDEQQRARSFIDLFQEYSELRLGPVTTDKSTTDGSLTFSNGALYCNLEVKVEKGSGNGDPYMQSIAYYIRSFPNLSKNIQYPCFLLELCGTAFSVSGILNTDKHVICDPLSPTFQLYHNQEYVMLHQTTKLFAALVKNLKYLRDQELKMQLQSPSSFPYLSSFNDMDTKEEVEIQYQQKIQGLVFSAKCLNSDQEVIVKFCSRYNKVVHLYCQRCGFAPRLISYSTHGSYIVVVMEKLNLSSLTDDQLSTSEIIQQIDTISCMLEKDDFVHGDLRACNVQFDTVNNKVVVVDFDWAGRHGEDLYPPFMNPAIEWPYGASTGEKMYHEHDVYWLNLLLRRKDE